MSFFNYYLLKPPDDLVEPELELDEPLLNPPPLLPERKPPSLELLLILGSL